MQIYSEHFLLSLTWPTAFSAVDTLTDHPHHMTASVSACIRLCMPSSISMRLQDLQVPPDYCGTMQHYLSAEHNQM